MLKSIILICLIVTLVVLRKYYQSYYRLMLNLNVSLSATTIFIGSSQNCWVSWKWSTNKISVTWEQPFEWWWYYSHLASSEEEHQSEDINSATNIFSSTGVKALLSCIFDGSSLKTYQSLITLWTDWFYSLFRRVVTWPVVLMECLLWTGHRKLCLLWLSRSPYSNILQMYPWN